MYTRDGLSSIHCFAILKNTDFSYFSDCGGFRELGSETRGPWFDPRSSRLLFFFQRRNFTDIATRLTGTKKAREERVIIIRAEIDILVAVTPQTSWKELSSGHRVITTIDFKTH